MGLIRLIKSKYATVRHLVLDSQKGIKDMIANIIPQGVGLSLNFISYILIARGLGPSGLGQYALVQSIALMVTQLSDLGVGQTAIRYASREVAHGMESSQYAVLRWAFRLRLILVSLLIVVLYFFAPVFSVYLWKIENLTNLIRIGLFAALFNALASVPIIYFQSMKRFWMYAIVFSGQSMITFSGVLFLELSKLWSIEYLIIINVLATALGSLAFLLMVPKHTIFSWAEFKELTLKTLTSYFKSPKTCRDTSSSLDHLGPDRFAIYMMISTVIVMVILNTDVWLMGAILNERQVGLYGAAMRFTLPLTILLNAMTTTLWPRASSARNGNETISLLKKTLKVSALLSGMSIFYAIFAPLLATLLFGNQYAESSLLGQLLCIRACISIFLCPINIISYNYGIVRHLWIINIVQFLIVITINLLLLPLIGPKGSAIALIINDLVGLALILLYIRQKKSHLTLQEG